MKSVILYLFIFIPTWAFSQAGPHDFPDLTGATNIGRIVLFKSNSGISWFSPTAFSSRFDCFGSAEKTCTLQIFNWLTADETNQLNDLAASEQLKITFFRDTDSQIVRGISERFYGWPGGVKPQVMPGGTLAFSKSPDSQATFQVSSEDADRLIERYATNGIGTFESDFQMQSQKTEAYLGLNDGACVKDLLLKQGYAGLSEGQVDDLITTILGSCLLTSLGFEKSEAEATARYHIKKNLFGDQGHWIFGSYKVNIESVQKIIDRYVIYDLVSDPAAVNCTARLALKAYAHPSFECH